MTTNQLDITPDVTVHNILETYPELEDVLIGIAPPFKKLKNPVLRKTVAKVATIKHVSSVAGVPLGELINTLRQAVGQPPIDTSYVDEDYFQEKPAWFSADKIVVTVKESDPKHIDTMSLVTIQKESKGVNKGEIIELETTFLPAPGIDQMRSKGYSFWVYKDTGDMIRTYFLKNS